MELYLTPKPGLVDLVDSGSHPDLTVQVMEHSIGLVAEYLDEIADSLIAGEPFSAQKHIAVRAEQRQMTELGTNTHKGFIFLSGMLLIAQWQAASSDDRLVREALSSVSRSFFSAADELPTNGQRARKQFNSGGIVSEAISAYPSLFNEALPVFRKSLLNTGCVATASFAMLARLMQTVDDTTTLHRAGPEGLSLVKRDGRRLEQLIESGADFGCFLEELNQQYIQMNITIGGVADMVGMAYGYLIAKGDVAADTVIRLNTNSPR